MIKLSKEMKNSDWKKPSLSYRPEKWGEQSQARVQVASYSHEGSGLPRGASTKGGLSENQGPEFLEGINKTTPGRIKNCTRKEK